MAVPTQPNVTPARRERVNSLLRKETQSKGGNACPQCRGTGHLRHNGEALPCDSCDCTGRLIVREAATEAYIACAGSDIIDSGGPLAAFVTGLASSLLLDNEDVAVWLVRDDDEAPRLVAHLRPGRDGRPFVTYL